MAAKQCGRKGPGDPTGHQAEHETGMCPWTKKAKEDILGCTRRNAPSRSRGGDPNLLSPDEATPRVLA